MGTTSSRRSRRGWVSRLELPAYPVSEVAQLIDRHRTTVSSWYYPRRAPGARHPRPILTDRKRGERLSYLQLVEAAFVATLRKLGVSLKRIRMAHEYLCDEFGLDYPLAQLRLKTEGRHILYDLQTATADEWEGPLLVEASSKGQLRWPRLIARRLAQFDYDDKMALAIRWFPHGKDVPVVVDPRRRFGKPILVKSGVPTWFIRDRYLSSEPAESIADDFGIDMVAVRHALGFEGVAMTA